MLHAGHVKGKNSPGSRYIVIESIIMICHGQKKGMVLFHLFSSIAMFWGFFYWKTSSGSQKVRNLAVLCMLPLVLHSLLCNVVASVQHFHFSCWRFLILWFGVRAFRSTFFPRTMHELHEPKEVSNNAKDLTFPGRGQQGIHCQQAVISGAGVEHAATTAPQESVLLQEAHWTRQQATQRSVQFHITGWPVKVP